MRDLLYALLLQSANDAAIALADHVSGSEPRFEAAMNARARQLGMDDSRFRSPNGLDDSGYSTARRPRDAHPRRLATQPEFGRIAATKFDEIPSPSGPPREIQNRDVLLWLYPGAVGVKTGYTARAGYCVVAVAQRGGRRLVAVVLGAPGEPFSDAATLLNYGFAGVHATTVRRAGRAGRHRHPARWRGAGRHRLRPRRPRADRIHRSSDADRDGRARGGVSAGAGGAGRHDAGGDPRAGPRACPAGRLGVPPPPPLSDERPWWARAAGSVVEAVGGVLRSAIG